MDEEDFRSFVYDIIKEYAFNSHHDVIIPGEDDLDTITNKIVEKASELDRSTNDS